MKHVYYDDGDYVIANSPNNAAQIWEHFVGEVHSFVSSTQFEQLPDSQIIGVTFDPEDGILDGLKIPRKATKEEDGEYLIYKAMCCEWAKSNKRMFLCSENY